MRRNLFIDTNVYLTFFHFSNEDLKELKKLIALINTENIRLFLPEQTKNEFYRNREVKISDSLDKLRASKLANQFPMICHAYEEYDTMKKAIKQFEKNKSKLLEKLQHDAENATLIADDVLNQLLSKAITIKTTKEILDLAVTRFEIGNPPGKDKSYGDAINWVSLLHEVPKKEDLYFVSEDKDYYSKLNDTKFNEYLIKEWKEHKNSKLFYFKRLSEFFKTLYPDIEISSETEKEIVIKNLMEAYSFENAKNVIKKLQAFDNFSIKQLNEIASAFSANNQIHWINTDYVVSTARRDIIEANKHKIESSIYKEYQRIYRL
jgi:PIN domain